MIGMFLDPVFQRDDKEVCKDDKNTKFNIKYMEQKKSTDNSQLEKPKNKNVPPVLGWILTVVCVAIVTLILIFWFKCTPWWVALILMLAYLLLLIINYLNKNNTKKLGWLFGILLAIMPVIVLISIDAWTWWMWIIAIGLYIFTLATYFMGLLLENYWRVVVPLSLFLILMLIFMSI